MPNRCQERNIKKYINLKPIDNIVSYLIFIKYIPQDIFLYYICIYNLPHIYKYTIYRHFFFCSSGLLQSYRRRILNRKTKFISPQLNVYTGKKKLRTSKISVRQIEKNMERDYQEYKKKKVSSSKVFCVYIEDDNILDGKIFSSVFFFFLIYEYIILGQVDSYIILLGHIAL